MTNDELRQKAEAALTTGEDWFEIQPIEEFLLVEETAACGPFMAAASPKKVLELLDTIDAQAAKLAKAEARIKRAIDLIQVAWPSDIADKPLWQQKKIEWLKGLVERASES